MKKCVLILPYFGNFKEYFKLFLNSVSNNNIDLLIITDNDICNVPSNIKIIKMSFDRFKEKVQNKFNFKIWLETPYKLCDYKSTYGYIFEDIIKEYDYWGYCDCDLIFGDLNNLLLPLLEKDYDKLFCAGHLTIYKNSYENNRRFMKSINGKEVYKDVLNTSKICFFDEDYNGTNNINTIFIQDNCKIYAGDLSMNCSTDYYNYNRTKYDFDTRNWKVDKYKSALYYYHNGKVLKISLDKNKLVTKEFLYMHFQGRKMKYDIEDDSYETLKILPDKFIKANIPQSVDEYKKNKKVYFSKLGLKKYIRRIMDKLIIIRCKKVYRKLKKSLIRYKEMKKNIYTKTLHKKYISKIIAKIKPLSKISYSRYNKYINKLLIKQLDCVIKKYENVEYDCSIKNNSKDIWVLWYQGEKEMPPIISKCYKNLCENFKEYNIHILTKDNYMNYVSIPNHIMDKLKDGKITFTHFSDILRAKLLRKYGGYWIDSTILSTSNNVLCDKCFYSIKMSTDFKSSNVSKGKWCAFFISGEKENPLFAFLDDCFDTYWKNNDKMVDYFLIDYIIHIAYSKFGFAKQMIDNVNVNNENVFDLLHSLNNVYTKDEYEKLFSKNQFYKLTYKNDFRLFINKQATFFNYLTNCNHIDY